MPTRQQEPDGWHVRTANDRFKDGAADRLQRAIVVAAFLHLILFLWSPEWIRSPLTAGPAQLHSPMELVALGDANPPGGAGGFMAPPLLDDGTDEAEPEGEGVDDAPERGPDAGDLASHEAGGSADLQRLAALRPALPEPDPEPEPLVQDGEASQGSGSDEEGEDATRIREHASDLDYERLSRDEVLELERLSALRPELAFTAPSNWILLRNPSEVGDFLEERFGVAQPGSRPEGSFSVALWIDEQGSVEWAEINRSSGREELDESALELFMDVVAFRPARQEGVRVPTAVIFWLSYW